MASPEAAVRALDSPFAVAGEFRVVRVRNDAALGVTWVDVGRCDHPEWPVLSVITSRLPLSRLPGPVLVTTVAIKAGETVRAWRKDAVSSVQVAAVSEQSGAVGDRIRLRLARAPESGEPVRYLVGLVRGPADVEMER